MKRFVAVLLLLVIAFGVYWFVFKPKGAGFSGPKMHPLSLKKHTEPFNSSIDNIMNAYFNIKDAFINDDTAKAKASTVQFISYLDSLPLQELKKDTVGIFETAQSNINDIKSNAQSLLAQTTITEMRRDFSMVTEMMYPSFFKTINYEGPVIYLQNCPMAFGEDQQANWISNSNEVVNPYLGKIHPTYKATMLHCGEVKDSIKAH